MGRKQYDMVRDLMYHCRFRGTSTANGEIAKEYETIDKLKDHLKEVDKSKVGLLMMRRMINACRLRGNVYESQDEKLKSAVMAAEKIVIVQFVKYLERFAED